MKSSACDTIMHYENVGDRHDAAIEKQWLRRDIGLGALAVIVVAAASVAGQLATYPNLKPWYAELAKPSFNPPNWIFAPVWTTLFVLMAFSVWRILRLPRTSARRTALALFFIQLALNAAWSWMFFAAHSPPLGIINIVPQWLITANTSLGSAGGSLQKQSERGKRE